MIEDVVVKCKLLVQNRDILKNEFQWASTNMIPLCAYYFAREGKRVDAVRMKECRLLMKRSSAIFTRVKGDDLYPFAAMLALEKNVNKALEERIEVYQTLEMHYKPSVGLTMAAFLLAKEQEEKGICIEETVTMALGLEEKVRKERAVQEEERIWYLLLALTANEEKQLSAMVEAYFEQVQRMSLSKEAKAAFAVALALGDCQPEETVHKLEETLQEAKERKLRIGEGIESVAFGMVAVSGKEPGVYLDEIAKINDYLKGQKGFDSLYLAAKERLMYASLLATEKDAPYMSQQMVMIAILNSVLALAVLE